MGRAFTIQSHSGHQISGLSAEKALVEARTLLAACIGITILDDGGVPLPIDHLQSIVASQSSRRDSRA